MHPQSQMAKYIQRKRTFAARFKSALADSGLSQTKVSQHLSVTRQTVSKWALGLSLPNEERLAQLARLFACSAADLTRVDEET